MKNKKEFFPKDPPSFDEGTDYIYGETPKNLGINKSLNSSILKDEHPDLDRTSESKGSRKLIIGLIISVIVLLLAVGSLLAQKSLMQKSAQTQLQELIDSTGSITVGNGELVSFSNGNVENANSEQKALSSNGEDATAPAMFIFKNSKSAPNAKVVDFYLDFSEQRGRDAFNANALTLKNLVESGRIELRIHALLGGRAYSMYAAETLAEVFATEPDIAWDIIRMLIKESPEMVTIEDANVLAETIANKAANVGSTNVDKASIRNGTFASWLITVGDDTRLAEGVGLPLLIVDGSQLSLSVESYNNSDKFKKSLTEKLG